MVRSASLARLALLAVTSGLVIAGCSLQTSFGAPPGLPASSTVDGGKLFQEHCTSCHGARGDRIPSVPLSSKEFLESRRDATLASMVTDGKGVMPAFGKAREGPLTDEQVRSVVAYLNQSAGRQSSTLLAGQGRGVYLEQCVRCHGEKGDRVPVAPLSATGFLESRSDAELVDAVAEGIGVMPGFRQGRNTTLSEEQVRAVVAYLRYNVDSILTEHIRRGRDRYVAQCLTCHGERGERTPPVTLASPEYLTKLGDGAIAAAISDGKGKHAGLVRAKGGTLGTDDVGAILAYLKAWSGLPADIALAGTQPPAATASAGGVGAAAGLGKELFTKNCAACHGEKGERVPTANFTDGAWLQQRGDAVLSQSIATGRGMMPGFAKDKGGPLGPDELNAIMAYLKSLAGPATATAPAASAPVAGSAGLGKELYTKNCTVCHGEKGDKVATAVLADGAWLQQRGDAALSQSIATGKGMMPAFAKDKGGPFSPDDLSSVMAYLKSLAGVAPTAGVGGAAPAAASPSGAPSPSAAAAAAPASAPSPAVAAAVASPQSSPHAVLPTQLAAPTATALATAVATATVSPATAPVSTSAPTLALSPDDAALVAHGSDLYRRYCTVCHGETAAKMGRLVDGSWLRARGDKALARSLTEGKSLPGDPDAMPGFGKDKGGPLGPDDVAALIGYLKSLAGIPLTEPAGGASEATLGKELYTKNCTVCHGEKGDKVATAVLADGAWLQQRGDDALNQSIATGKGMMPAFAKDKGGPFSPDDLSAILAYLKALAGIAPGGN